MWASSSAISCSRPGAEVAAVVEKAAKIGGYGVHAAKLRRAGVPIITGATVKEAHGGEKLEEVVVASPDGKGGFVPGAKRSSRRTRLHRRGNVASHRAALAGGREFDFIPELGASSRSTTSGC